MNITAAPWARSVRTTSNNRSTSPEVSAAVDRKLATIRDTYAALYDEATVARGTLLEVVIVVLIMVEIVLAVLHL